MSYYLPQPPRAWSRVQDQCTYVNPNDNYTSVYSVLTNQTISLAQADYQRQLINKGNILQYKSNNANFTKKQKYSQLAKGFGPNRKKVFATQSTTYTNPNMTGLFRVGSTTIPFPNTIVGQPNNISGPYEYDVANPFDCSSNGSLVDGGHLVCGTYANPCTNEIIVENNSTSFICNPSYCSNVPGFPINLCWDTKLQPWYPKPRYFMNNSTDKWPINYKGFVSALTPEPPVIQLNDLLLSWTYINNCEVPISSFKIYVNNQLFISLPYTVTFYTFTTLNNNDTIYMTSLSNNTESKPSNTVIFMLSS